MKLHQLKRIIDSLKNEEKEILNRVTVLKTEENKFKDSIRRKEKYN